MEVIRWENIEPARHARPVLSADGGPPIDDDYMGPRQLAYFRQKLLDQERRELRERQTGPSL